jgi:putative ABC transport system permease protein
MNLAVRDVRRHWGRFVVTMLGLGLLVSVILTMNGIYRGNISDGLWLINAARADLWVVEKGRPGPFNEQSRMPESTYRRLAAIHGVEEAAPFLSFTVHRPLHDEDRQFTIVGYDVRARLGRPPTAWRGRDVENAHFELVADAKLRLAVGEKVRLGLHDYTVVGVLQHAVDSAGLPLVYLPLHDAQEIFFQPDNQAIRSLRAERSTRGGAAAALATFSRPPLRGDEGLRTINAVLVRVAPGASSEQVEHDIDSWLRLGVVSAERQRDMMLKGKLVPITAPLVIFRLLLLVVCTVIMTLVIYVFTIDKLKSLATLRMLGAPAWKIVRLVLDQSLILAVGGFAVGGLLVRAWRETFPRTLVFIPGDTVLTFGAITLGATVAGAVGIRRALRTEPSAALGG